jgi:hypothetical protein
VFHFTREELIARLARSKSATARARQRGFRVLRRGGALLSLALAALAVAGCGGSSPLPGSYTAKVSGSTVSVFDGEWTLTLRKDGSYTVVRNRQVRAGSGPNSELRLSPGPGSHYTDTRLVITNKPPGGCGGAQATGTYALKHAGSTVTLTTISDACSIRPLLLERSFKRTTSR